jgi:hypothetical protein
MNTRINIQQMDRQELDAMVNREGCKAAEQHQRKEDEV